MPLPPGPRTPTPLVTWNWLRRPYPYLDELRAKFGEVFTIRLLGLPPLVFFSNPDAVREVFTDDGETLAAGQFNQSLAPLLGETSVLMADGKAHIRKRKLLLPPFHGERMQAYGAAMIELTERALAGLPRGTPVAIHPVMQEITLRVIVRTVFGVAEGPRFEDMVARTARILELGAWPPLLIPIFRLDLGKYTHYGRFREAVARGDELIYREIRERRRTGERGTDILSLLLDAKDEAGETPSELELRDELVTLLVAGHETTATALTWALRWLLDRPNVFADMRAAVDALGPSPKPEEIARCELLDAAAREALRLIPVIPLVGRVLQKPAKVGGWDLPAGAVVVCSIYLAHRRPEAYPNAAEFDPQRFVGRKVSAYEFFPFGGGLRRCIGMAFALYEMKMVLARILALTDLSIARTGPIEMGRRAITVTPEGGLPLIVRERRRATRPDAGGSRDAVERPAGAV